MSTGIGGTNLEFSGLFEFHHVTLAFERTASCEEDIFMALINIFRPGGEPGHCVIVLNGLPFPWHIGNGNWSIFSDVQSDIFRSHSVLKTV